jgi:peptidoglycan/xylan/chitin deacetylase (PgdA/CDA1 family)
VSAAAWPGGAPGALSLSFDNLGEAAEVELGAVAPDAPLGDHFTAKRVLPRLLDQLEASGLPATFFVEGLNAELYPDELRSIAEQGHEVAYHAWRHEQWRDLSAPEQADNLRRGRAAFAALGLEPAGLRPPGGGLGAGGTAVLGEAGLRYCSPAGEGVGVRESVALVPFQWRHVDASCVLPPFAGVREGMTGSPDPIEPDGFLRFMEHELERLAQEGGQIAIVLHLFMLDWLGEERLAALLDRVAEAARRGSLWVARCDAVAAHALAHAGWFHERTVLDSTSWTAGNT